MYKKITIILILLFFTAFGLGCSSPTEEQTVEPTVTSQVIPTPMNDPDEVAELVEELLSEEESKTEEAESVDATENGEPTVEVDFCIECHTDKEMLIDTAKPEEEVISENEGEG
jgi:hypothetical protein